MLNIVLAASGLFVVMLGLPAVIHVYHTARFHRQHSEHAWRFITAVDARSRHDAPGMKRR